MNTAAPNPNANSNSLWSWEVFLLGGCSIVVCMAAWAFTDKSASVFTISQLAFGLAFAVNHPHFLSSYALLYKDFRANILARPHYFWAAAIVPAVLGSFLIYAFAAGRADLLGYSLNAMFFLVGWHYVKQVFGCVIVTSARRRIFYTNSERRWILANLFSLWAVSWLQSQVGTQSFQFYGIAYAGLGFPSQLLQVAYFMTAFTALTVVGLHLKKYIEDGVKPSMPGVAALGSLYVWYLPTFAHPTFAYLIPLFHSLQYLTFVWSFKSNQVTDQVKPLEGREQRAAWVRSFLGYAAGVTVLGAMAFEFVPKFLDGQQLLHNPALGSSPFVAAFLIFINVHHYFIDNVIWRSNNTEVKKYLFAAPTIEVGRPALKKVA